MHVLLHLLIRFKGKGIFVMPILGVSFAIVYGIAAFATAKLNMVHNRHTGNFLFGIAFIMAGIINSYATRNYTIDMEGGKQFYAVEGEYLSIKVTLWTRIFIVVGILIILAKFADMLKL